MIFRFGLFEFDADAAELRKQGRLVRLEPQPARALHLLLVHAGQVVSREQLRARLWDAGTHVDFDRGLAYCLGQVRTALGDSADNPRFVETLPRRGYRFIAPVQSAPSAGTTEADAAPGVEQTENAALAPGPQPGPSNVPLPGPVPAGPILDPGASAPPAPPSAAHLGSHRRLALAAIAILSMAGLAWTAWARRGPDRPLVAVAIFDNETGRAEFDRLASTAADVMVERLTGLGSERIGVIGNTPTLRQAREERDPADVQRETGAAYFVFGQVQEDDTGVRLVVHLTRLEDDTHLWVTRVARAPGNLADIQDVVADRLAEAVRRHVIERDPAAPRFTR